MNQKTLKLFLPDGETDMKTADASGSSKARAIHKPETWLNDVQRRWLQPRSAWLWLAYRVLHVVNWVLLRLFFRVEVHGVENLPKSERFILASNHSSPLDPPLLAFALPLNVLEETYWAGKRSTVMKTFVRRCFSRVTRVIPISNGGNALASGAAVLQKANLVWFPEGRRSLTGELQKFKPGIAKLLNELPVLIVPVRIEGAFDAFQDRKVWPRFGSKITIRIGQPRTREELGFEQAGSTETKIVLQRLRDAILSA